MCLRAGPFSTSPVCPTVFMSRLVAIFLVSSVVTAKRLIVCGEIDAGVYDHGRATGQTATPKAAGKR